METQTLLCLGQPLQQDVNSRVKLLSLQSEDISQTHTDSFFTVLSNDHSGHYGTWHSACSSRACLDTERLHTVSQRVLSSCIWTLTQDESSWLLSISSLAERLRAWTLTVLFPSSFWKTCRYQSAKETIKHHKISYFFHSRQEEAQIRLGFFRSIVTLMCKMWVRFGNYHNDRISVILQLKFK